jgi:hypothetical protein
MMDIFWGDEKSDNVDDDYDNVDNDSDNDGDDDDDTRDRLRTNWGKISGRQGERRPGVNALKLFIKMLLISWSVCLWKTFPV